MDFLHLGPVTLTTFLASFVEFVEALTIVLAVGITRSWKSAFAGTAAAIFALALLLVFFGPSIQLIPIKWMQLGIGAVVLIFGLRWLHKATLRSAGLIAMHDEKQEFAKQVGDLTRSRPDQEIARLDKIAFLTAFKGVFLEGFEVVFIVVTAGSVSGHFGPATVGAVLALILVIVAGVFIHEPLARVPENSMKKTVGILLSSFGVFWLGEGLGFSWPLGDASLVALALLFWGASLLSQRMLERE